MVSSSSMTEPGQPCVMISGNADQPILSRYYHNGFLPSRFQGVQFQSAGDPVLFLSNPPGIDHLNRGRNMDTRTPASACGHVL